jgi:hypothetical protein
LDEDEAGQEWLELYDYGVDTMERHGIRVLPMSRLVAAAATAARELGI